MKWGKIAPKRGKFASKKGLSVHLTGILSMQIHFYPFNPAVHEFPIIALTMQNIPAVSTATDCKWLQLQGYAWAKRGNTFGIINLIIIIKFVEI